MGYFVYCVILNIKYILLLLVASFFTVLQGQDKKLLKQYVYKQFELLPNLEINYNSDNLSLAPPSKIKTDKPSIKKIEELSGSYKLSNDISHLHKIGELYLALNKKDSAKCYLKRAAFKYQEKLNNIPEDIETLRKLGKIMTKLGDFRQALSYNDSIIAIKPNDTLAITTNVLIHLSMGSFSDAKKYCKQAFDIMPKYHYIYLLKTLILINEETTMQESMKNFVGFKSDFSYLQKAFDTYIDNPNMQLTTLSCRLLVLASEKLLISTINPPQSVKNHKFTLTSSDSLKLNLFEEQYTGMIGSEKYPNKYTLYYSLGIIHLLKGHYIKAIEQFKTSIDLCGNKNNNHITGCFNNIMTSYLFLGDNSRAKKWTLKKIRNNAFNAGNHIELARYDLAKGNLSKGEKRLNKALELDSAAFEAYVELANVKMINGDIKIADRLLNKCYKINPDYKPMYESLILSSLFRGDYTTAHYLVKVCLKNNPRDAFALDIKRDFLN